MSRRKRIAIFCIAILLCVLGFICIAIAANAPSILSEEYTSIIGLSSFAFWGLAVFVLVKNFTIMVSSEMNEMAERMHNEENFFSTISAHENTQTLEDRFKKSGFKLQQGYLHKRQFSLAKDYINYYIAIAQEENIIEYFETFLKKAEELFQDQSRFHKNNVIYLFFFTRDITQEELDFLKNIIINQEVMQGLPGSFDTVLPIVYDTANQNYIVRTPRRRFSIALLDMALRNFYKMITAVNT